MAVVLFGAVEYFSGGVLRTNARDIFSPVWSISQSAVASVTQSGVFASKAGLAREVALLTKERDELRTLSLQNDVLKSENASLRALLSLREERSDGKAARVLSRPGLSPYSTFVIGAGSEDGIQTSDHVFVAPGLIIGDILEVGERTSLVGLFSAPGKKTSVKIGENTIVEYMGRGAGNGIIEVPRGIPVQKGDSVFLANSRFLLGVVGEIEAAPEDALQRILVAPPANLPALEFVFVAPKL